MDHKEIKAIFSDYHDGQLDEKKEAVVKEHLKTCADCKKEWETFQKTINEISGLMMLNPPEKIVSNVERKIRRRSGGKFFAKQSNTQYALVSFILVLFFILAYLLLCAVNDIILLEEQKDTAKDSQMENKGRL